MYLYFFLMGLWAWGIALGYRYRASAMLLTLFWGMAYFMQKTHYNNHYYFALIIAFLMCFLPANRYFSLDVKQRRIKEQLSCTQVCLWIFVAEITLVYTYAAIAKLYPGWIYGDFIHLRYSAQAQWFENHFGWQHFADFLRSQTLQQLVVWGGIFFDLFIVPMLLWKKTRTPALILTLIFHLANSIVLQIGIFPYFALSFALFFYSPDTIRRVFFKKKKPFLNQNYKNAYQPFIMIIITFLFVIQTLLPLRHYLIKDDVFWTEEGHRLSWRMMLRTKSGYTSFTLEMPDGKRQRLNIEDYLTRRQAQVMQTKPDMIWQWVQYVKKKYRERGIEGIKIFAKGKLSLNGGKYYPFINDTVDLAKTKWHIFKHEKWLLPSPKDFNSWKKK